VKPNVQSDPVAALRQLSSEQLARVGEQSLRDRLQEQAVFAHLKHGPLTADKLETVLSDPDVLRYPTRLVFEFGEMAMHQFAQPNFDQREPEGSGRVLYVRPSLREQPGLLPLAVAYMIPLINYSQELIGDEHCLLYGATLMGMMEPEFYGKICALADSLGAEARYPEPDGVHSCSG
jgi:hypothetical protein